MFTKLCHTLLEFQLYLDSLGFENIMVVERNMALHYGFDTHEEYDFIIAET